MQKKYAENVLKQKRYKSVHPVITTLFPLNRMKIFPASQNMRAIVQREKSTGRIKKLMQLKMTKTISLFPIYVEIGGIFWVFFHAHVWKSPYVCEVLASFE